MNEDYHGTDTPDNIYYLTLPNMPDIPYMLDIHTYFTYLIHYPIHLTHCTVLYTPYTYSHSPGTVLTILYPSATIQSGTIVH